MGKVHGRKTVITIGAADISAYCTASEFDRTNDTHDSTGFGLDNKTYEPGLADAKVTIEGNYDTTAVSGPRAVFNALFPSTGTVAVVRQVEGAGAGLPQDSVAAIASNYKESSPVGDIAKWSCEMQCSGPVDSTPQA